MARDNWVRTVTVTTADLQTGDWETRDRNPVALAIARVLRPGMTVFVDIRQEEFFLGFGTHNEWYLLPDDIRPYAYRACEEQCMDELTFEMAFEPWALETARSRRKRDRDGSANDPKSS